MQSTHNGSFTRYAAIATVTIVGAGFYAGQSGVVADATHGVQTAGPVMIGGWAMLVSATFALVFLHRNRLLSLILIAIVGLMVAIGFVFFSAPDLAMTQITVEVVTILLLLLALNFLPNRTPIESTVLARTRDVFIAAIAGISTMGLSLHYLLRDSIAPFDL